MTTPELRLECREAIYRSEAIPDSPSRNGIACAGTGAGKSVADRATARDQRLGSGVSEPRPSAREGQTRSATRPGRSARTRSTAPATARTPPRPALWARAEGGTMASGSPAGLRARAIALGEATPRKAGREEPWAK